jgi:hypothetical protein
VKNEIVNTSSPYDTYYIIADYLVSLKVGTKTFALKSGAQNDFYQPISLGEPNSDTLYGEIPSIG